MPLFFPLISIIPCITGSRVASTCVEAIDFHELKGILSRKTPLHLTYVWDLGGLDSPLAPDKTQQACSFWRSSTCENPEDATLLDCHPLVVNAPW